MFFRIVLNRHIRPLFIYPCNRGIGNFVLSDCRENLEARMVDQQVQEFVAKMRNVGLSTEFILEKVKEALGN